MADDSETICEDEHGTYRPDAGSPHPLDREEDDLNYEPCNAVLRHTWDRYGERRYCSAMAVGNFSGPDTETSYEYDKFCKNHQMRGKIMERHEDAFKTGAYAKSHRHKFQHMPPHNQILANDLYKSLLSESTYEFDSEDVELRIDVSGKDFGADADKIVMDHPIPSKQNKKARAKALWHAALDFVTMESIKGEQFRVAAEEEVNGRELVVGETKTYIAAGDDIKEVADEHHLNLALSRIQKNYKEHMKFGGVEYEQDPDSSSSSGGQDWVVQIEPEEPVQPSSKTSDESPLETIEIPSDAEETGDT